MISVFSGVTKHIGKPCQLGFRLVYNIQNNQPDTILRIILIIKSFPFLIYHAPVLDIWGKICLIALFHTEAGAVLSGHNIVVSDDIQYRFTSWQMSQAGTPSLPLERQAVTGMQNIPDILPVISGEIQNPAKTLFIPVDVAEVKQTQRPGLACSMEIPWCEVHLLEYAAHGLRFVFPHNIGQILLPGRTLLSLFD